MEFFCGGPLNHLRVFDKHLYLMNQRWWNNEIICIMLGINQRYFSSKKDSVEMFSAYMQEINLKILIIFNLFYLHFCFGPHVCIGNSSFRICRVVTCRGSVRNIILLHTCVIFPLHFTKKCSRAKFWQHHSHDLRQANLCWVLFQSTDFCHCFQYIFQEWELRLCIWYFLTP